MKLVYIAGPYRHKHGNSGVSMNIAIAKTRAVELARRLHSVGFYPVTPHLNTANFEMEHVLSDIPDEYWLEGTMEMMERCDAVLLVSPSAVDESDGTRAEVTRAHELGIPVFATMDELVLYAKNNAV